MCPSFGRCRGSSLIWLSRPESSTTACRCLRARGGLNRSGMPRPAHPGPRESQPHSTGVRSVTGSGRFEPGGCGPTGIENSRPGTSPSSRSTQLGHSVTSSGIGCRCSVRPYARTGRDSVVRNAPFDEHPVATRDWLTRRLIREPSSCCSPTKPSIARSRGLTSKLGCRVSVNSASGSLVGGSMRRGRRRRRKHCN